MYHLYMIVSNFVSNLSMKQMVIFIKVNTCLSRDDYRRKQASGDKMTEEEIHAYLTVSIQESFMSVIRDFPTFLKSGPGPC